MMNAETVSLITETIAKLETEVASKKELDLLWAETKQIILKEIEKLPDICISNNNKQNKKFKKGTPFWNEELEALWLKAAIQKKLI